MNRTATEPPISYDADKLNHIESNQNFRIKDNMKAGYGIVFKEGDHHVDRGPPVSDLMKQSGHNYKYSLTEYSRLAN